MADSSDGEATVTPDAHRDTDARAPARHAAGVATTIETEHESTRGRPTDGEPPIKAGDLVGDRYRVRDLIGKGGMGLVFLAEHITIEKPVAIKVLGEEYSARKSVVERFMLEARAASLIRHPHIVDITDFGFVRDGVPYFVMEYLEGQTLADRIYGERRLAWPEARAIIVQICTALQAAHDKGVIHRDVKPENVFLLKAPDGAPFVKVLDFGIAKIIDDGNKSLTRTGTVMGTAGYMSPEQAQSQALDVRTDVYSAGIILYEMLTGRVPFDGDGFVGVLTKHVTEQPLSLRRMAPEARIPAALDRVVLRALHKEREDRYASADEFADALRALGDNGAASGWRRWAPAGVVTGAIVGAAVWTFSGVGDPPSPHPAAPDVPTAPTANDAAPAEANALGDSGSLDDGPPAALPAPTPLSPVGALPDLRDESGSGPDSGSTTAASSDALPPPPEVDASTSGADAPAGLPGINDPDQTDDGDTGGEWGEPTPQSPPPSGGETGAKPQEGATSGGNAGAGAAAADDATALPTPPAPDSATSDASP